MTEDTVDPVRNTHEDDGEGAPVGVWIFMGMYVVFLISVAAWSYREGKRIDEEKKKNPGKDFKRSDSKIEEHYVASRSLGAWSLALTLLASTWSGYTVVGAPQDTYRRGWNATRYMGGFVITQSTMLLVCARMQWYAFKRNYVSTVDFVTDRFRSHFTRVFVSIAQLLSTVLYVMGQFKSIGATVEGMSNGAVPAIVASIVMCVIMLAYEWFGGMRAIALTDLVQGIILIVGCCVYFIAMEIVFDGGISRTTDQLRTCATMWDTFDAAYEDLDVVSMPCRDQCNISNWSDWGKCEAGLFDASLEGAGEEGCGQKRTRTVESKHCTEWPDSTVLEETKNCESCDQVNDETDPSGAEKKDAAAYCSFDKAYMGTLGAQGTFEDGLYEKECVLSGVPDGSGEDYGAKDAKDLLTINRADVEAWLPFYVAGISFPIYPQILVRFYTAQNVRHLQYAMQLTHLSVFYLCLPAFLTGYTILSRNLPGLEPGAAREGGGTTAQAFAKIMDATIEHSWFFYLTGCLTVCAAIAAYMSTADSALMAASSMITLDFTRDYYYKRDKTPEGMKAQEDKLYLVAKGTSVFFGTFAVITTLWEIPLTDLYILQGAILMFGCPAYFFGMYNKTVNAFAVNAGICVGILVFVILWAGEFSNISEFWATIANIGVVLVVSYTPALTALWYGTGDVYDPERTPNFLNFEDKLDKRVVGYDISVHVKHFENEPIRPWWVNFIVFLLLFIAIPFWQNIPSSYEDQSFSGAMPTWAVVSTFFAAIAMLINIFQTYYNWSDWIGADPKNKMVIQYKDVAGDAEVAGQRPTGAYDEASTQMTKVGSPSGVDSNALDV